MDLGMHEKVRSKVTRRRQKRMSQTDENRGTRTHNNGEESEEEGLRSVRSKSGIGRYVQ